MFRLTRMVLGTALAIGLAASPIRAAEPDKLLPADADTVVQVNVKQVLDSDIVKKYALEQIKQTLDGEDAKKLLTQLGLDPLKDINKIVVGASVKGRDDMQYLMIVHGAFDPDKLRKAAEAQAKQNADQFAVIKDGNTMIFKFTPDSDARLGQPVFGAVVNDKTVIAGSDQKMITTALKAAESGKPAAIKPELAELVRKMDEKASFSAVGLVKGKFEDVQLPGGGNIPINLESIQKLLPKIETMSLSVKVGADVNVDVTLGMKDNDSAKEMHTAVDDLIKQVKPLATLAGEVEPRAKPLADVLTTIKTTSKARDVSITGTVTGANIGKALNPNGN